MYRTVLQILLKGISVLLPVIVAIYVLSWLVLSAEGIVKTILVQVFPDGYYIPGIGIVFIILLVFFAGLLMYPWVTRKLIGQFESLFRKIPFLGSVYSPIKDLMDLFGSDMEEQLGRPVMIRIPNTDIETLGFVTREHTTDLPKGFIPEDCSPEEFVVVYVQWSSQIGGYCFVVPKASIRDVDMTVEEGMRWALTAGLSAPSNKAHPQK